MADRRDPRQSSPESTHARHSEAEVDELTDIIIASSLGTDEEDS